MGEALQSGPDENASERRARLRRAARLAAVQALYQMEITGRGAGAVAAEFLSHRLVDTPDGEVEADAVFFEALLSGVVAAQDRIDGAIGRTLKEGWKLSRVDATVRAILRAGGFELIERLDVPAPVVIDEYVEIAKAFFEGPEPAFVNGALDALARAARPGAVS